MTNTLYYGDNLTILREYIKDESVDLIYLDPPFNSNRNYNVLFRAESGQESESQLQAFDDTWHWNEAAEAAYHEIVIECGNGISRQIGAMREALGTNQMMAYLVMMAIRLVELHRVLKDTGSLYLHCDPTASHYLKIILDTIFGVENFRNEIIWQRTNAHNNKAKRFQRLHDIILFYTKDIEVSPTWNDQIVSFSKQQLGRYKKDEDGRLYTGQDLTITDTQKDGSHKFVWRDTTPSPNRRWAYSLEQLEKFWEEGLILTKRDGAPRLDGLKVYLDEKQGKLVGSIWHDIARVGNTSSERLGYPTQKPLALLERIIQASSKEGDIVLDPFCGCGTTVAAAEKLNRRWLGIDITHLAITLQKYRLQDAFPEVKFAVVGEPQTVDAAHYLAQSDRHQFEWWALSLVKARPSGARGSSKRGKKGADQGIDGVINFIDEAQGKPKRVLVQVKSGRVSVRDVRDLVGTVEREKAAIGVLISLNDPTKPMLIEALKAGFYRSLAWQQTYRKLQLFTIEGLLAGGRVEMPPPWGTFKQAQQQTRLGPEQTRLDI